MLSSRPFFSTAFSIPQSTLRHIAPFHVASAWRSDIVSHYETLGVDPSASAGDIKRCAFEFMTSCRVLTQTRQFYLLSKTHHPDHNPNDPQASERFVKISEAYAVLGSLQKREIYDREVQAAQGGSRSSAVRGSHSSSSSPFGSRPASGLSQRRTKFKGPPPSFYRNGGWGPHGSKRQAQAEGLGSAGTGEPRGGGFRRGQEHVGFNDVPHFDQEGHHRTQELQDERRRRRIEDERVRFADSGSVVLQFSLVAAVITLALSIPTMFDKSKDRRRAKDDV